MLNETFSMIFKLHDRGLMVSIWFWYYQQKVAFYILLIFHTILNSIFATYLCKKATSLQTCFVQKCFLPPLLLVSHVYELTTPSSLKPFKSLTVWHWSMRFAMYYCRIGTTNRSISSFLPFLHLHLISTWISALASCPTPLSAVQR